MESVMNNNDLRRIIFKYFRKKLKIKCNFKKVCIWEKKL